MASKLAQLQYLWKVQDSGTASALTWGLSAYTSAGQDAPWLVVLATLPPWEPMNSVSMRFCPLGFSVLQIAIQLEPANQEGPYLQGGVSWAR